MEKDSTNIIGISIARKNPYGRNVVIDSIKEYLFGIGLNYTDEEIDKATIFEDSYIGEGYGRCSENVRDVVKEIMQTWHTHGYDVCWQGICRYEGLY